jgi:hypothetical protein
MYGNDSKAVDDGYRCVVIANPTHSFSLEGWWHNNNILTPVKLQYIVIAHDDND